MSRIVCCLATLGNNYTCDSIEILRSDIYRVLFMSASDARHTKHASNT